MNRSSVLLGVLGVASVVAGIALWSIAAALIAAGLGLLAGAWLTIDVTTDATGGGEA
jgi:hypothetical protein